MSSANGEIMMHFYEWYKPTRAIGGIKHLVEHQARCGDTEFFRPETKTVENLDDLDDSSDDSPQVKYDGSWSRTFDAALILVETSTE